MNVKAILHTHSTYSYDAKLSLSELKALLQQNGVNVACMTEHTDELTLDRAHAFVEECEALSDESFLFIPGFEVPYKHAHVLMIGMREFFGNYAPTIEALTEWTQKASFVVLAHPVRNHFEVDDGLLREIDALEVWNQQYDGKRVPRSHSLSLLSELRERKPTLLATGGVDLHRKEHQGAPLITFSVERLTESAVLEKLITGAYTVSSAQTSFFGTLPDITALTRAHRTESFISVSVIVMGKFVNRMLAGVGISLPKGLKQVIRRRI